MNLKEFCLFSLSCLSAVIVFSPFFCFFIHHLQTRPPQSKPVLLSMDNQHKTQNYNSMNSREDSFENESGEKRITFHVCSSSISLTPWSLLPLPSSFFYHDNYISNKIYGSYSLITVVTAQQEFLFNFKYVGFINVIGVL